MDDIYLFYIIYAITSGVLIAFAIPLILKKIPVNDLYGIRCKWSMYNDKTWYKSNIACGYCIIFSVVISIIFALLFDSEVAYPISFTVSILLSSAWNFYYSYKIYKIEILKNNK